MSLIERNNDCSHNLLNKEVMIFLLLKIIFDKLLNFLVIDSLGGEIFGHIFWSVLS